MFDYESIGAGYYDDVYHRNTGAQSKWHHLKFKYLNDVLASFKWESLLDIACGPGTFVSSLPAEKNVTGIDISKSQIDFAEKKYGTSSHRFRVVEAGHIPFPDNSFDVVTSIEFIEHVSEENGLRVLAEAKRCLKPGGRLLMTTPNYLSMWPILELIVSKTSAVDYTHQHIDKFNRWKLRTFLTKAGFQIDSLRSFMHNAYLLGALSWSAGDALFNLESRCPWGGNLLVVLARKPE